MELTELQKMLIAFMKNLGISMEATVSAMSWMETVEEQKELFTWLMENQDWANDHNLKQQIAKMTWEKRKARKEAKKINN